MLSAHFPIYIILYFKFSRLSLLIFVKEIYPFLNLKLISARSNIFFYIYSFYPVVCFKETTN